MLHKTFSEGQHEHIGLNMRPGLYATLSQTPYTVLEDPGDSQKFPTKITAVKQENIHVDHAVILKILTNHINMDIVTNTLLLEAVTECYLHEIRNQLTGYLSAPTMDLLY